MPDVFMHLHAWFTHINAYTHTGYMHTFAFMSITCITCTYICMIIVGVTTGTVPGIPPQHSQQWHGTAAKGRSRSETQQ